jgi:predicted nucleic acid-binding protein
MTVTFVDTGAWFARFVPSDPDHPAARAWFERNTQPLVTTDYVIDELLTLLKVRGEYLRAVEAGPQLLGESVCDVEWVSPADVHAAWQVFVSFRQACKNRPPRAELGGRPTGVRVANGSARVGDGPLAGRSGPIGRR